MACLDKTNTVYYLICYINWDKYQRVEELAFIGLQTNSDIFFQT
jgi:hypothetical protein